jgi:hypothetical protein
MKSHSLLAILIKISISSNYQELIQPDHSFDNNLCMNENENGQIEYLNSTYTQQENSSSNRRNLELFQSKNYDGVKTDEFNENLFPNEFKVIEQSSIKPDCDMIFLTNYEQGANVSELGCNFNREGWMRPPRPLLHSHPRL